MPHRGAPSSYSSLDRYLDNQEDVTEALDGLHNVTGRLEDYVEDEFIARGFEGLFGD